MANTVTLNIPLLKAIANSYTSLPRQTMQSHQKIEVVPSSCYKPVRVHFTEGFPPARRKKLNQQDCEKC